MDNYSGSTQMTALQGHFLSSFKTAKPYPKVSVRSDIVSFSLFCLEFYSQATWSLMDMMLSFRKFMDSSLVMKTSSIYVGQCVEQWITKSVQNWTVSALTLKMYVPGITFMKCALLLVRPVLWAVSYKSYYISLYLDWNLVIDYRMRSPISPISPCLDRYILLLWACTFLESMYFSVRYRISTFLPDQDNFGDLLLVTLTILACGCWMMKLKKPSFVKLIWKYLALLKFYEFENSQKEWQIGRGRLACVMQAVENMLMKSSQLRVRVQFSRYSPFIFPVNFKDLSIMLAFPVQAFSKTVLMINTQLPLEIGYNPTSSQATLSGISPDSSILDDAFDLRKILHFSPTFPLQSAMKLLPSVDSLIYFQLVYVKCSMNQKGWVSLSLQYPPLILAHSFTTSNCQVSLRQLLQTGSCESSQTGMTSSITSNRYLPSMLAIISYLPFSEKDELRMIPLKRDGPSIMISYMKGGRDYFLEMDGLDGYSGNNGGLCCLGNRRQSRFRTIFYPTSICNLSTSYADIVNSSSEKSGPSPGLFLNPALYGLKLMQSHQSVMAGSMCSTILFLPRLSRMRYFLSQLESMCFGYYNRNKMNKGALSLNLHLLHRGLAQKRQGHDSFPQERKGLIARLNGQG